MRQLDHLTVGRQYRADARLTQITGWVGHILVLMASDACHREHCTSLISEAT